MPCWMAQLIGSWYIDALQIKRSFEHAHQVLTAALVDRHVTSYLAYIIRTDDAALQDRPGPELRSKRSNADAL